MALGPSEPARFGRTPLVLGQTNPLETGTVELREAEQIGSLSVSTPLVLGHLL